MFNFKSSQRSETYMYHPSKLLFYGRMRLYRQKATAEVRGGKHPRNMPALHSSESSVEVPHIFARTHPLYFSVLSTHFV